MDKKTEIVPTEGNWLELLPDNVRELFELGHADNTLRGYHSDLEVFSEWCNANGITPLPCRPVDLVEFLTDQSAAFKINTVKRRAAAVSYMHRKSGYLGANNPRESPFVKEAIRLLARRERDVKIKKSKELSTALVREIMLRCKEDKNTAKGARDRAIILIGFASAMRRSNLVNIEIEHLDFVIQGMEIYIPHSKTDQVGDGHTCRLARGQVPITCPIEGLRDWLHLSGITEGKIFRAVNKSGKIGEPLKDQTVWRIVKERLKELGREDWDSFGGHSLRAGFASTAADNGASIQAIKTQGAWKRDATLMEYLRNKEDWDNAASYKLGL